MGQTEIKIFIVLFAVVILIFITGFILFIVEYGRKKILYIKEKTETEKQHKLDLLSNQLSIQQQTMQFIGREIHDSVTQKLTLATIYAQKLEFENKNPVLNNTLVNISDIINDSLVELRDLSRTLVSNNLSGETLQELLLQECKKVNSTGIMKAKLESASTVQISILVKSSLLRIVQEFIQNSLKHSGGSLIEILVKEEPGELCLKLSDNGKGFDTASLSTSGVGIENMKRRMQNIGGRLKLESELNIGTTLELFIHNNNLLLE